MNIEVKHIAIFTTNRDFAKEYIDSLKNTEKQAGNKVCEYRNNTHELVCYMEDGSWFQWVKSDAFACGRRCNHAVIDISTCSLDYIKKVIYPMCIEYNKRGTFEITYSKNQEFSLFEFIEHLKKIAFIEGDVPIYYYNHDSAMQYLFSPVVNEYGLNLYGY